MPSRDLQYTSLSTWTLIRFFAIIIGLVLLYFVKEILAALFFAVIIASAMEPGIVWLQRRRIPRLLAAVLIYLGIAAFFFFVIYLIFPLFIDELANVFASLPTIQKQVIREFQSRDIFDIPFITPQNVEELLIIPTQYLQKLSGGILDFGSTVFGGVVSFLLIIVSSFYLAIQERGIENFLRLITPISHEHYIIDLWRRSQQKLGLWLRAQLLLGAIMGVLIFFGLTFLGVPHAMLFATISGLFEVVPIAGPILAAIPGIVTAFLTSTMLGFWTFLLYLAAQQTESHVIVPVVMSKTVGLNPLIVVIALVVGAKIGGLFGVILAVPITTILVEFLNDWDKKKREFIEE